MDVKLANTGLAAESFGFHGSGVTSTRVSLTGEPALAVSCRLDLTCWTNVEQVKQVSITHRYTLHDGTMTKKSFHDSPVENQAG